MPTHLPLHPDTKALLTHKIKPEGAHPYEVLVPHVDITWASPKGGRATLDPVSESVSKDDLVTQAFLK
jgi:hypothetical protein